MRLRSSFKTANRALRAKSNPNILTKGISSVYLAVLIIALTQAKVKLVLA